VACVVANIIQTDAVHMQRTHSNVFISWTFPRVSKNINK
jgi:hypothetical protein